MYTFQGFYKTLPVNFTVLDGHSQITNFSLDIAAACLMIGSYSKNIHTHTNKTHHVKKFYDKAHIWKNLLFCLHFISHTNLHSSIYVFFLPMSEISSLTMTLILYFHTGYSAKFKLPVTPTHEKHAWRHKTTLNTWYKYTNTHTVQTQSVIKNLQC